MWMMLIFWHPLFSYFCLEGICGVLCVRSSFGVVSKKIFCFYMSYPDDIFDKWSLIIMISLYVHIVNVVCTNLYNLDIIAPLTNISTPTPRHKTW